MYRIGFIDLDTSHARSFIGRINSMEDCRVTAVFDRGRVRGRQETGNFCREFGVDACACVEELVDRVDGVMVLSVDWNTHADDLEILLKAGRPCFCDKPVVGSLAEIERISALVRETGTPFVGGSGWRWNQKVRECNARFRERRVDHLFVAAPNWRFFYGIHAVECALGILGPGADWVRVERHSPDEPTLVSLGHCRGAVAHLLLQSTFVERRVPFTVDGKACAVTFDGDDIHDGICGIFAGMLRTGRSPATPEEMLESVRVMLAVEESLSTGQAVECAGVPAVDSMSSLEFMDEYIDQYRKR